MDQYHYLSRTLWQFCGSSDYTDITLVCADGSLPAHAAMLAGLFTRVGINFPLRDKVPDCIFIPDLSTTDIQMALKALYLHNNGDFLRDIFDKAGTEVKIESYGVSHLKKDIVSEKSFDLDQQYGVSL